MGILSGWPPQDASGAKKHHAKKHHSSDGGHNHLLVKSRRQISPASSCISQTHLFSSNEHLWQTPDISQTRSAARTAASNKIHFR